MHPVVRSTDRGVSIAGGRGESGYPLIARKGTGPASRARDRFTAWVGEGGGWVPQNAEVIRASRRTYVVTGEYRSPGYGLFDIYHRCTYEALRSHLSCNMQVTAAQLLYNARTVLLGA